MDGGSDEVSDIVAGSVRLGLAWVGRKWTDDKAGRRGGSQRRYRPTWHGNSAMDISAAVRDLMPMSLLLWLDPTHATASRTAMDGDSETQNHSRHGPNDVPSKGLPRTPLRTRGGSSSRLDMKRSS